MTPNRDHPLRPPPICKQEVTGSIPVGSTAEIPVAAEFSHFREAAGQSSPAAILASGAFPGETSCLTLVRAVLDLYMMHATNGVRFTQLERQRLKRMRYEGSDQTIPEEVSAA